MAREQVIQATLRLDRAGRVSLRIAVGVAADLPPEPRRMADEDSFRAGLQRPFEVGYRAAIPAALIDRLAGLAVGQIGHVQVQGDRAAQLARFVEQLQAARIVEGEAELPLPAGPHAVNMV